MSLNKRLINTGGAAGNPYSLENATLLTAYTISGETRNWRNYEFVADNRVYALDNGGIIYHYALNGTTQSVWSTDIRRYQGTFQMSGTLYSLRFISTPSAGYIYVQGDDTSSGLRKIQQAQVGSNGTWFISTGGQLFSVVGEFFTPSNQQMIDIDFNSDGTKMYLSSTAAFYVYNLSTPYMINTATLFSTSTDSTVVNKNFRFTPDGTRLFTKNAINSYTILQYDLSTPFDHTTKTLSYTANSPQVKAYDGRISFNGDGTVMYLNSASGFAVSAYSL